MLLRTADLRRILDDFGQDLTLKSISEGTYDPSTGGMSGGSTTTSTVKVYLYNFSLEDMDGSDILMGDRKAVFLPEDTSGSSISEPEVGDQLTGEGDAVSIISVRKVLSAGSVVCYICQVRE